MAEKGFSSLKQLLPGIALPEDFAKIVKEYVTYKPLLRFTLTDSPYANADAKKWNLLKYNCLKNACHISLNMPRIF